MDGGNLQLIAHRVTNGGLVAVGEHQRRAVGGVEGEEVDAGRQTLDRGNSSLASSWVIVLM